MKHKRKISVVEAIARVNALKPVAVAPSAPRETLQSFRHKFDFEEKQRTEAPIREAEARVSASLRQLINQDQPTLFVSESSFLAATAPQFEDGQCDGIPVEDIKASIRRAFIEAEDEIAADGRLTESGKQKLQNLSRCNLSTNWLQSSAWVQAYRLLRCAGELSETDFIATPAPEQESTATFDDVLNAIPDTYEGRKDAKTLCDADYFLRQGKPILDEWIASLLSNFDFVPTEAEQKLAIQFCIQRGLSFLDRRTYDTVRKNMVARGLWPERCLTNADKAELLVESSPAQTYDERQTLKHQLALLNRR
jgi:hypothetical protein